MSKPTNTASAQAEAVKPAVKGKEPLKKLFEERNRTRPGSREEEEATKKILESVFPDSNAD